MLKQIIPSLYTLTGMMVGRIYLVEDEDGLTLVDAGSEFTAKRILKTIIQSRYQLSDLKRIVITHAHPDHAGNLPQLIEATGAKIFAPAGEIDALEGRRPADSLRFVGDKPPSWLPKTYFKRTKIDYRLEDGDTVPFFGGIIALSTPGHTTGHMSYWQPEKRVIFCGDVLIRFPRTRLPFRMFTQNMQENIRSLAKLNALEPDYILPGHGEPITENAARHLDKFTKKCAGRFGT